MRAVLFRLLVLPMFRIGHLGSRFVWDPDVLDAMNPHTRRAYVGALRRLETWLDGQRLTDHALSRYLLYQADAGRGVSAVEQVVSAVRYFAKSSGRHGPAGPRTAAALKHVKRLSAGCGRGQAPSATLEEVETIVNTAPEPRTHSKGRRESVRRAERRAHAECALIAVLFMGALRVSEAAALRWSDVTAAEGGEGVRLWVRRSKSNPYGAEADVRFVKGILAEAVLRWREVAGADEACDGRVFGGLTAATLSRRVTAAARAAGIEKRLTAHSFRVGLTAELTRRGASLQEVMHAGGWKSPAMAAHYSAAARADGGAVARLM